MAQYFLPVEFYKYVQGVILGPYMAENQKKGRKQTPPKIQFYLLGGVFSPVYNPYTPCIHHVYHASEWYIMQVFTWQLHGIKY